MSEQEDVRIRGVVGGERCNNRMCKCHVSKIKSS